MPDALLTTKLHIPQAAREFVPRPHLTARLDEGLKRKLTLVSAPAGFGKSTLVADWLAESGLSAAWPSLDAGDSDPARFWTYLIAAVQTVHAAERGKHVYVEKPATHNMHEDKLMVAAQKKYGKVVQMGTQYRSMARTRQVCQWVRNGRLGKVHTVRLTHRANRVQPCEPPGQPAPNVA